ncbi:putative GTP-binding transporter [Modestobacter italicus]|uniref:GTPase HflX n=1 Tax=Modestobacter italicus (strain DSM 44449 / CECT 9708 / BC 501) TaxID=2732864 RepID=I4ERQ7_MODI5|nr:GTPase HflX [Modestobacter marinus]CCH86070.1 putative GTP-binding transporter [Modestobacter marinus]
MPGPWLVRSGGTALLSADDPAAGQDDGARAVLLGLEASGEAAGGLDELERLAETDGVAVVGRLTQARDEPDPATYLGSGKVAELAGLVRERQAGMVIADGELSPAQVRNLEERLAARVVDRTALILDIFGQHARSSEGRAQVELAQLAYQLPRLRGQGTELSRVGGGRVAGGAGIGVRGPGEQRLETERRHLRRRMALLRRQVAETGRRRARTRSRRRHNQVPSVAITGYTNAGKSALLNRLTGADALVQDALFATLDPTVRQTRSPGGRRYTLTDTVGFVRHLPHQLVDAFRSTLEEVVEADLVLHVVDASAPDAMDQVTTVRGVLYEIGARDHTELLALNKVDVAPPEWLAALRSAYPDAVAVSALTGEGIEDLRAAIDRALPPG